MRVRPLRGKSECGVGCLCCWWEDSCVGVLLDVPAAVFFVVPRQRRSLYFIEESIVPRVWGTRSTKDGATVVVVRDDSRVKRVKLLSQRVGLPDVRDNYVYVMTFSCWIIIVGTFVLFFWSWSLGLLGKLAEYLDC